MICPNTQNQFWFFDCVRSKSAFPMIVCKRVCADSMRINFECFELDAINCLAAFRWQVDLEKFTKVKILLCNLKRTILDSHM